MNANDRVNILIGAVTEALDTVDDDGTSPPTIAGLKLTPGDGGIVMVHARNNGKRCTCNLSAERFKESPMMCAEYRSEMNAMQAAMEKEFRRRATGKV